MSENTPAQQTIDRGRRVWRSHGMQLVEKLPASIPGEEVLAIFRCSGFMDADEGYLVFTDRSILMTRPAGKLNELSYGREFVRARCTYDEIEHIAPEVTGKHLRIHIQPHDAQQWSTEKLDLHDGEAIMEWVDAVTSGGVDELATRFRDPLANGIRRAFLVEVWEGDIASPYEQIGEVQAKWGSGGGFWESAPTFDDMVDFIREKAFDAGATTVLGFTFSKGMTLLDWKATKAKGLAVIVQQVESGAETKECPYCAETILAKAVKCRYCHSALD